MAPRKVEFQVAQHPALHQAQQALVAALEAAPGGASGATTVQALLPLNFAEPSDAELLEFARRTHHSYLARRQISDQIDLAKQELAQWPSR